ncbi:MAG: SUMF1/EgtB/PvdO family nonheme iron enzyme [Rhodospirillaceae bacterium]|nr:SUMF1/EgtB/PvdO family nonheme iron enzyme [Rhodospirillaceae bacterium]
MGRYRKIQQTVVCTLIAMMCGTTIVVHAVEGADLPPEIEVDRLLVQADRESREGNHWSAVFTLERVLQVSEEHGLEIATAFWFRQAGAFQNAEMYEPAVEALTRYLNEAGRDGEYYQAALELLDAAEVGLAEARWREAQAKAAAERAARDAEARRAAIAPFVPEMVFIPAGTFRMGCVTGRQCRSSEKPVRDVRIESFELSKYEVTFAQWDTCVEYGGCRWVEDEGWGRDDSR